MKTRIRLKGLKFDRGGYSKTFKSEMLIQVKQAARAWLRAIITDNPPRIPTYLGTSRGSLIPLGQYLKVSIPIHPNPKAKPKAGLGPSAGAAQGFFEFKILEKQVQFSFKTNVAHFIQNEFYEAPEEFHLIDPTPWHTFKIGREAFNNYLANNLKNKIPKIKKFITREDIFIHG